MCHCVMFENRKQQRNTWEVPQRCWLKNEKKIGTGKNANTIKIRRLEEYVYRICGIQVETMLLHDIITSDVHDTVVQGYNLNFRVF